MGKWLERARARSTRIVSDNTDKRDKSPALDTGSAPTGAIGAIVSASEDRASRTKRAPASWLDLFNERAAILQHDEGMSRGAAELRALEILSARWQFSNPRPPVGEGICVHCERAAGDCTSVTLARDSKGVHHRAHWACHPSFIKAEHERAVEALAAEGVTIGGERP